MVCPVKTGKKACSYRFDIDSISVRTQIYLITQETKMQKSGCQQPVHQEPRGSVLAVETGHTSTSWALYWVNGFPLYFLYCWPCSSKSSSLPIAYISLSPSCPHQHFFLRSKKIPQNMATTWHLCWPPVRGIGTWLVHSVGYFENVYDRSVMNL